MPDYCADDRQRAVSAACANAAGLIRLSYGEAEVGASRRISRCWRASLLHNVPHASDLWWARTLLDLSHSHRRRHPAYCRSPPRGAGLRAGAASAPAAIGNPACLSRRWPQRDLSFFRIFPPQTSMSLMRAGVPALRNAAGALSGQHVRRHARR
jgi:hypothetical protein